MFPRGSSAWSQDWLRGRDPEGQMESTLGRFWKPEMPGSGGGSLIWEKAPTKGQVPAEAVASLTGVPEEFLH